MHIFNEQLSKLSDVGKCELRDTMLLKCTLIELLLDDNPKVEDIFSDIDLLFNINRSVMEETRNLGNSIALANTTINKCQTLKLTKYKAIIGDVDYV